MALLVSLWLLLSFGALAQAMPMLENMPVDHTPRPINYTLLTLFLRGMPGLRPFYGPLANRQPFPTQRGGGGGGGGSAASAPGRPPGFNVGAYALYNPQFRLWGAGNLTEVAAVEHYNTVGKKAGARVICSPIPLFISYPHTGRLANLIYTSVTAWSMAVVLGADVLLPEVHNYMPPSAAPAAAAAAAAAARAGALPSPSVGPGGAAAAAGAGAGVVQGAPLVTKLLPFERVFHLQTTMDLLSELGVRASTDSQMFGSGERQRLELGMLRKFGGLNMTLLDLPMLVQLMTREVVGAAVKKQVSKAAKSEAVACDQPPTVHMRLMDTLRTDRFPLGEHLVRNIRFSPEVEHRAKLITAAMAARGYSKYNAVHLGMEHDSHDHHAAAAGAPQEGRHDALLKDMLHVAQHKLGWRQDLPVYVACAPFLRFVPHGLAAYERAIRALGPVGSVFLHQSMFDGQWASGEGGGSGGSGEAAAAALPPLGSEQAAAVDVLVLMGAKQFVGRNGSALSEFVAFKRLWKRRTNDHSALV